jgi:endonuclease YncB( thermonuclease family)
MLGKIILLIVSICGIFLVFLLNQNSIQLVSTQPLVQCAGNFTATVNRVIDGDTLELKECSRHIRLSLVNTPEVNQRGWSEATNFTKSICIAGSRIQLQQDEGQPYDVYGRIVAVVYCQNKNLNEELVKNNLAVIMTEYCARSEFSKEGWAWNDCKQILGN